MPAEPGHGEARDGFERAGFFEQVRRPGDHLEPFLAIETRVRLPVQLDDFAILAAYDEQGGRQDLLERIRGEIGPPAARYHCPDQPGKSSRRDQRRSRAGARAEISNPERLRFPLVADESRRQGKPTSEQENVEPQFSRPTIPPLLLGGEQIEEQSRETCL